MEQGWSHASVREAEKVDWNGTWLCTDAVGMDGLLKAMGVPYLARQAVKAMKYGIGKLGSHLKFQQFGI